MALLMAVTFGLRRMTAVSFEHGDERVVVDQVVERPRAHDEAPHDFARMDGFVRPSDYALFHQINHAVGKHLGVDAEVFVGVEGAEHGVGDGADAHLQGRAGVDQLSAVLADGLLHIRKLGTGGFRKGRLDLDPEADLVHVNEPVAVGAGHVRIDLHDHVVRALEGGGFKPFL